MADAPRAPDGSVPITIHCDEFTATIYDINRLTDLPMANYQL